MKAKTASMVSKIIALVWIVVGESLVGVKVFSGLDWWAVIIIGLFMAVIFVTTDISLVLQNITAGKSKAVVEQVKTALEQPTGEGK